MLGFYYTKITLLNNVNTQIKVLRSSLNFVSQEEVLRIFLLLSDFELGDSDKKNCIKKVTKRNCFCSIFSLPTFT